MSLQQQINDEIIAAMKAKEAVKLTTLRMAKSAIQNKAIELGTDDLEDDAVISVLSKLVKQREESIAAFNQGGRPELAENEQAEIDVLKTYLPEPLGEAELTELVKEAIAEVGATSQKEMGQVMKAIMAKAGGRADGKMINTIVREQLS